MKKIIVILMDDDQELDRAISTISETEIGVLQARMFVKEIEDARLAQTFLRFGFFGLQIYHKKLLKAAQLIRAGLMRDDDAAKHS